MTKAIHAPQLYLAGSGVVPGDTSITLTTLTDIDGNTLTFTDFGGLGVGTCEPGVSDSEEEVNFTGITANVNGTFTLTGVTHVLPKSPYTQTVGVNKSHSGGSSFVITNGASWYNRFTAKDNDETVTGSWSFPTPTVNSNPATKLYADSLAIAGSPDSSTTVKGIGKLAQAPVSATDPIFVGDNDTRLPTISQKDAMATITVAPSSTNRFLTENELNVTAGVISAYAGSTAPSGYFLCNGQAVSRTTYANLFAVCGTLYGIGDGSTTFNVPNLTGRVPVGIDGSADFLTLGQTGGAKTHTLIEAEMPSHSHNFTVYTSGNIGSSGVPAQANNLFSSATPSTATSGGNSPHNNLQPYCVVNYIIKQ